MTFELTSTQRETLLGLVDQAIMELGPEIHHTVTRSYKDDLRELRQNLWALRVLLSGGGSTEESACGTAKSELVGTP
jgi:hypothetical protein